MIVEMRTYTLKPGTTAKFEVNFQKGLPNRLKLSPLGAFWHTEVGTLNQVIHLWPYESTADRDRCREEAYKLDGWPPEIREFVTQMETKILIPATVLTAAGAARGRAGLRDKHLHVLPRVDPACDQGLGRADA
jgi:NIPSNAP